MKNRFLDERVREGFENISKGQWLRLRLAGEIPTYAKVKHIGREGIEIDVCEKRAHQTSIIPGFEFYTAILGFREASEEEVQQYLQREPAIKRYFNKYVRLGSSASVPFCGKISEILDLGIILRPYIHSDLATGKLKLAEKGEFFVRHGDIQRITPSTRKEIEAYIREYNRRMENNGQ